MGRRGLAAAAVLALLAISEALIVTKSASIEDCVNAGGLEAVSGILACKQKVVLEVGLTSAGTPGSAPAFDLQLQCISSPTGACPCPCDYTIDPGCTCRDLSHNVTLSIAKPAALASYPLTPQQSAHAGERFNGRPYEEVKKEWRLSGYFGCSEKWSTTWTYGETDRATCGYARFSNDTQIFDSQGFCCACNVSSTVGGSTARRGGLSCDAYSPMSINSEETAHCMRLDESWWHWGYTIGAPQTTAPMTVSLSYKGPAPESDARSETLALSPEVPLALSDSKRVAAAANLSSGLSPPPPLAGKWLFVRQREAMDRATQLGERSFFHEWMVLNGSQVTADGSECNKVGVSYTAFRNSQANKCFAPVNGCLANQLADLYTADDALYKAGKAPLYFVSRWGGGSANEQQGKVEPGGRYSMQLPLLGAATSTVSVTVDAEALPLVVAAPVEVVQAKVCTTNNRTCNGAEPIGASGFLRVDVRNRQFAEATCTVSVGNCVEIFRPIAAQTASVPARSTRVFSFEVRRSTGEATATGSCTVSVTDSTGAVLSSKAVAFSTQETFIQPPPAPSPKGPSGTCSERCPSIFNVVCAAKASGCIGRLAQGIAIIAGPALALLALLVAWHRGYLSRTLSWLLGRPSSPPPAATRGDRGGKGRGGARSTASKGGLSAGEEPPGEDAVITVVPAGKAGTAGPPASGAFQPSSSMRRVQEMLAALGWSDAPGQVFFGSNPLAAGDEGSSADASLPLSMFPPSAVAGQYAGTGGGWTIPAGMSPSPDGPEAYSLPGSPMHAPRAVHAAPPAGLHMGTPAAGLEVSPQQHAHALAQQAVQQQGMQQQAVEQQGMQQQGMQQQAIGQYTQYMQ